MSKKPTYEELEQQVQEFKDADLKRRQAEKALRESEEKYREFVEGTDDFIAQVDGEGRLTYINRKAEKVLGISTEKCIGLSAFQFIHPDDRERTKTAFAGWVKNHLSSAIFENRQVNQTTGQVFHMHWTINLHYDEAGNLKGVNNIARDITVLKKTEEALRSSETKYKTLIDNMNSGVAVYEVKDNGSDFVFKDFNNAAEKIDNTRKDRLIGKSVFKVRPGIVTFGLVEVFKRVWQTGIPEHFPVTYYEDQVLKGWYENYVYKLPSEEIVAVFDNVTENKKTEEALRTAVERMDLATCAAGMGVWDWNIQRNELFWDERMYDLYQVDKDEFTGTYEAWLARIHPADREECHTLSEQSRREGKDYDTVFRIVCKDGAVRYIKAYGIVVRDDAGKPVRITGVNYDITETRKSEEALKESEQKYRNMMESFTDPLYICSPDFKIEYMNPAMIERIGRDASGEPCYKGLHGLNSKCEWCVFDSVTSGKAVETNIQSPLDGRHYRVANMPVKNPDGTLSKMTIFRDITEYLQAVAEKNEAQTKLAQAQKMESIGTLAGGIAHDFNNILSSIIGFTELSLDDVEKGSMLEDNLQEVYSAGTRAKELVRQILAYARHSDKILKPIQIDPIITEVLQFIRSTIPTTIEIQSNLESNSLVMGNPTQVHQIIMNLCTNAAYAMEDGGGVLSVNTENVTIDRNFLEKRVNLPYGDYVKISVSDTGTGIPPEIADSIFEPYFTTKDLGEGTGMGLAVVMGIVETYGGKITFHSRIGEGAAFIIYLPLTQKQKGSHQYELKPLPTGKERILLVDDEPAVAKIGRQVLERLGYQVTTRTGSTEALELFRYNPNGFDLVITDMTMPNMTGDRLAEELMKIRPDIPVILCTGYSKKISDETATAIGIRAFAYKPVVKAELANTVRKVLDEAKDSTSNQL